VIEVAQRNHRDGARKTRKDRAIEGTYAVKVRAQGSLMRKGMMTVTVAGTQEVKKKIVISDMARKGRMEKKVIA